MTKEVLEMIKESVEERKKNAENEKIRAKQVYTNIWQDILNAYKKNLNKTTYDINIDEVIALRDLNENEAALLKIELILDGFEPKIKGEKTIFSITNKQIETFVSEDIKDEEENVNRVYNNMYNDLLKRFENEIESTNPYIEKYVPINIEVYLNQLHTSYEKLMLHCKIQNDSISHNSNVFVISTNKIAEHKEKLTNQNNQDNHAPRNR